MRKSFVVMIIVFAVVALSVGTALAQNKPDGKGDGKGQTTNKNTAPKGQAANKGGSGGAPDKGSGNGAARLANKTSPANQATAKGGGEKQNQDTSYAFKGTVAQNGAEGSPLEVKVEKANDAARSFVGKNVKFKVSSDTESYLDKADAGSSKLDAKLSDLKAGDKVLIQAKAPENATSFTASLISAEASNSTGSNTAGANPSTAK